jgi:hypothetical protein
MDTTNNRGIGALFLAEDPHLPSFRMRAVCAQANYDNRPPDAVVSVDTKPQLVRKRSIIGTGHDESEGIAEDQTVELLRVNDFAGWVAFGEDVGGFVGSYIATSNGGSKNDNKDEENGEMSAVAEHKWLFDIGGGFHERAFLI